MKNHKQRWAVNRLSLVTAGFTFLLIILGAWVTNSDAGDSIPTWPLAFGRILPINRLSGGAAYEYSHRLLGGVVGILTLILVLWLFFRERRGWVKWVGVLAILLFAGQVFLGRLRVTLGVEYSVTASVAHAVAAELFLAVIVGLTVFTSPGWVRAGELRAGYPRMKNALVLFISSIAAVFLVVQAVLSAAYSHGTLGMVPYAAWGILVAGAVIWSSLLVVRLGHDRERAFPYIVTPAQLAAWFLLIQIALGIALYMVWSRFASIQPPSEKAVIIGVLHSAFGAALLSDQIILVLRVYRMVPITEAQA